MYIKSFQEWSWTLTEQVPLAYYHHLNGSLDGTESNIGTKPIFFFSENHTEIAWKGQKWGAGWWAPINNKGQYGFDFSHDKHWIPPPFKEYYQKHNILKYDKPTIVINNKWNREWDKVYSAFDVEFITNIINSFSKKYQILYIRARGNESGYADCAEIFDFNDHEILKGFNGVITIQDILKENPSYSYNEIQFMMEATSNRHLTVAGANAIISSYFGGEVFIYTGKNNPNEERGVWRTDSWLKKLSNAKIYGYQNYNELINKAKEKWL